MSGEATRNLAFVGDVHLDLGDPALDDFLAFLDQLGRTCSRVVLLGDLFNLWVGQAEMEQAHHVAVSEKLAELRRHGVVVRYLEGNRDYRIASRYAGRALDDSTEHGLVEEFGGHRLFAIHGDLANVRDRQYRLWRRVSRSPAVWGLFNLLPATSRLRLAQNLERRMRGTNLDYKREFPEAQVRAYAEGYVTGGFDIVVLGHFHVERELEVTDPGRAGRILVLPEWKGSRRHLEVRPNGAVGFRDSTW